MKVSDQAFIHRSYCNEHPGKLSNERLEFLGDSVLSLIISTRLYKLLPNSPEGELTSRRSHLVQTTTLSGKSIALGFNKKIKLSKGEEDSGGRSNISLMADTFEAVLGALYIDSGLAACEKFLLEVFPDSELTADIQIKDPKSLLQEKSQAAGLGTPTYKTVDAIGPDHAKEFTIAVTLLGKPPVTGTGSSKQRAETAAAAAALVKLFPN